MLWGVSVCFVFLPLYKLMLIFCNNSLLNVNSLLLGFLSVVLGHPILADLVRQTPQAATAAARHGGGCLHPHLYVS